MACDDQDPHPPQGVRPPAARQVGQRHRRDGEAHGRARGGPHPAAHAHRALHRAARTARRQEVARAVRDPHAQAPARHPRPDPADPRRPHEARPVGGRRRRDQELEERRPMATFDVFNMKREKVGSIELADEVFGAEVQASTSSTRWSRRSSRPSGRARSAGEEPFRRQRQHEEDLQAEGHGPRASRLDPRADLRRRRPGAPAAPARLELRAAAPRARRCAHERPVEVRQGGPPRSSSTASSWPRSRPRSSSRRSAR